LAISTYIESSGMKVVAEPAKQLLRLHSSD
jgi:hypothetical protein